MKLIGFLQKIWSVSLNIPYNSCNSIICYAKAKMKCIKKKNNKNVQNKKEEKFVF